jgi:outer membrane protein W
MKRIIFIILFIQCGIVSAQNKNHFGFKAGYISSRINHKAFNSSLEYSPRNMVSIGFAYNRNLTKILDLQIETLYSMKGYKNTILDGTTNNSGTKLGGTIHSYNADYIELPILLKLHTNNGKIKPFLNGGFSPSFNVSDSYNTFKSFDLGLVGSVGIDIPITKKIYTFLELRGNLGLLKTHTPLYSNSEYSTSSFYAITGLFF